MLLELLLSADAMDCAVDAGADADLGQHARDGHAQVAIVDVAVVGAVEPQPEAVRIAGLGQQTDRAGGIRRRDAFERRVGTTGRGHG